MNKGFCEKCNELVDYKVKEVKDVANIKGKDYAYSRLIGYCKKCGEAWHIFLYDLYWQMVKNVIK